MTGTPIRQLRAVLTEDYRVHLSNPSVDITPLRRINVLGEVNKPGFYPLNPTVSLVEAIAMANGVTPGGDTRRIRIVRGGQSIRGRAGVGKTLARWISARGISFGGLARLVRAQPAVCGGNLALGDQIGREHHPGNTMTDSSAPSCLLRMNLLNHGRSVLLLVWTAALACTPLRAQQSDSAFTSLADTIAAAPQALVGGLVAIGSVEEDRLRLDHLSGKRSPDGYLIRSTSSLTPSLNRRSGGFGWQLLAPELRTAWNSAIPFSLNNGVMWAGRGANLQLMAGIRAAYGPLVLSVAPQVSVHQNTDFFTVPYPLPDRSPFAYPWHRGPESLDLPLRFGDEPFTRFDLGQSSLSIQAGPVAIGAGTENLWWGPAIRNAIVMSNNAPGIPHAFLRTSKPVRTAIGALEGRWIIGSLQESAYFDFDPRNDFRSISAVAATLRLRFDPDLTLGFARAVYAPADSRIPLAAAFDVLRSVGSPNTAAATDTTGRLGPDQVFSLFGRWIFPESGFEAYAEWARFEQPTSLQDLLASPNHSQGYTLGLQWAKPLASSSAVRLQTELTYLEPSSTFRERGVVSSYTSRRVPQGYTHRGQVIGASIGPGASSQWVATDYLRPSWQIGLVGGRVRWDNAALYTSAPFRHLRAHDVSIFGGVRGSYRFGRLDMSAELTSAKRYNYLFQNPSDSFGDGPRHALDVRNQTLTFMVSPVGTPR